MSEVAGMWSQVKIAGKTADVYEPAARLDASAAVLHLHGHGLQTLAGNVAFSAELERHALPAICPHGQRSWWLDVICREFDPQMTPLAFLRNHVVPFIAERWGAKPPAVGLTGVSMGGQGALQLAYRHPREFPVVAAISPAVDFHQWHGQGLPLDEMFSTREAARQQTATLQFHPMNWPRHQLIVCDPTDETWFEGVERLTMKLRSIGIPFESDLETSRGGHSWDYFNAMAPRVIGFVAERLEQESRRV
ncbi:MAG: esterase [Planctomycetes bacterium]|nr:esterase [Planctomycetota bacterium]